MLMTHGSWDFLVNDVKDYIMKMLIEYDDSDRLDFGFAKVDRPRHFVSPFNLAACMLACTCKAERKRYSLLPIDKLTFDDVLCYYSLFRDDLLFCKRWVLPGERGKEYVKKMDKKAYMKIYKQEFYKPFMREKKRKERKERSFLKAKKYNLDVF